jgi:hypothetical protein
MMNKTTKGMFVSMKFRVLLTAFLVAAATLAIGGGIVWAQSKTQTQTPNYVPYIQGTNPFGWNLPYELQLDPDYPPYAIALKAMQPTYKGTLDMEPNPVIGIAEFDLNYDKQPEIIAFPTEESDRGTNFCNLNDMCPFYVIQIQGNKANVIGVLYGYKVNRGDRVVNKYLTLKVYNAPKKDKAYFEEYAYNPKSNEYEPLKK